jgi:hypothetical protein
MRPQAPLVDHHQSLQRPVYHARTRARDQYWYACE